MNQELNNQNVFAKNMLRVANEKLVKADIELESVAITISYTDDSKEVIRAYDIAQYNK